MVGKTQIDALESELNDFAPDIRRNALQKLIALAEQGNVPLDAAQDVANMHCHTFFSFNSYGYSPTGLVWLAKQRGYKLMGTVDLDVLNAVDEFLDACQFAGVRGSTGIEVRTYVPEFAAHEMNSPGEPGVLYHMGIGFTSSRVPAAAASILENLQESATSRNRGLIERINRHLDPVSVDYEADVLPMSPGGMPTERHITLAYVEIANDRTLDPAKFWSEKLDMSRDAITTTMQSTQKFLNLIRQKLMKQGGIGYVQPGPNTFPTVDAVNALTLACEALPCAAWLDGTSSGEQDYARLLDLLIQKDVVALNIIPDRNWNLKDPEDKKVKLQKLYEVVELAKERDLPLNIGTEMNSYGQRLMDDFGAPELSPVKQAFLDGAYFIYGHTMMQRQLKLGFQSNWAKDQLPSRSERNEFYTRIGYLVSPGADLSRVNAGMSAGDMLEALNRE